MFEIPRRGRQAGNVRTNVPKILDLKSSSEQMFPKIDVGCPYDTLQCDPQKKITVPHEKIPLKYDHNDGICLLWYRKRLRLHSTVITMTTAFSDFVCLYFDPDKRMKFGMQCSFQKSRNLISSRKNRTQVTATSW